jgi:hypothetical protein
LWAQPTAGSSFGSVMLRAGSSSGSRKSIQRTRV